MAYVFTGELTQNATKAAAAAARLSHKKVQGAEDDRTESDAEEESATDLRAAQLISLLDDDQMDVDDDDAAVLDLLEDDGGPTLSAGAKQLIEVYPDLAQYAGELQQFTFDFTQGNVGGKRLYCGGCGFLC